MKQARKQQGVEMHGMQRWMVFGLTWLALTACSGGGVQVSDTLMDPRGAIQGEVYVFRGAPPFRFKIPAEAEVVERTHPASQLVRVQLPEGGSVSAASVPVTDGFKLEKAGRLYLGVLSQTIGARHDLVSNKKIRLKDGTQAYETRIRWFLGEEEIEIHTVLVSALVRGSWVSVAAHNAAGGESLARFPRTLRFRR